MDLEFEASPFTFVQIERENSKLAEKTKIQVLFDPKIAIQQ